jgi:hypothetical protein
VFRGTDDRILLSQIRDGSNLEGQVSVFISPRNREAQLYPQALGFLFITSYDSQVYGGNIRTHLHAGCLSAVMAASSHYIVPARTAQKTSLPLFPVLSLPGKHIRIFVPWQRLLYCSLFTQLLLVNRSTYHNINVFGRKFCLSLQGLSECCKEMVMLYQQEPRRRNSEHFDVIYVGAVS